MDTQLQLPDLPAAISKGLRSEDDTWDKSKVHVSDLGYALDGERCARELYLRLRGSPARPLTDGELLMFDRSHSLHARLTELIAPNLPAGWTVAFVEHALVVDDAARSLGLVPDPVEAGQLDVELHGPNGERIILDYKTMRGRAFQFLEHRGPYETHKLQVRTYALARDADMGALLYADREGQNFCRQFAVQRDDDQVRSAAAKVKAIAESPIAPPVLTPILERRENKGPDSLSLKEPWQCARCRYRDVSCPGALPPELRGLGIVAKISKEGELLPQTDNSDVLDIVHRLLAEPANAEV